MLVLSRRENESIVFPSLGISVEVLRIRGNATRIGISAPADVPIQRHEIAGLKSIDFTPEDGSSHSKLLRLMRSARTHLDYATIALNHLHGSLEDGSTQDAEKAILSIFRELEVLDRELYDLAASDGSLGESQPQALLVDGDRNERELLAGFLRVSGFEVTTASDGADALDYLSLHAPPDIVLLDLFSSRCNAPAMIGEIRGKAEADHLKLFAVSEREPASLGVATGPSGIDRWFPKPVNPEKLVDDMRREMAIGR